MISVKKRLPKMQTDIEDESPSDAFLLHMIFQRHMYASLK
jgi:hypothetical protein